MSFRKQTGNMYDWINYTWNVIKGKCPFDCSYCYMKIWGDLPPLRFDEKEMKRDLGSGNFIFVGSSCDMWTDSIPDDWIDRILYHSRSYPDNQYLFQSKNPEGFSFWAMSSNGFPKNTILGTTIESNRIYPEISKAPDVMKRVDGILHAKIKGHKTIITIEPILDFDLKEFLELIKWANPDWVNVGADSKNHSLPEPQYSRVLELIDGLKQFTEVLKKSNLERLKL